jgi:FkbM family methyltransferase
MRLLVHTVSIILKILRTKYAYGRLATLKTYLYLLANSFIHYKLRRKTGLAHAHVLTFRVLFTNHSELVNLFEEIFIYQVYRFNTSNAYPLIIDAGSNIGLSTLYFKTIFPDSTIICIEPDQKNFELLKSNLELNQLTQVTSKFAALSNVTGKKLIYKKRLGTGSLNATLIKPDNDVLAEEVDCILLSDLVSGPVDLLKLDIEGSEESVLEDLMVNSRINLISQMVIEHHPFLTGHSTAEMVAKIASAGFECECPSKNAVEGGNESIIYCKQAL